MKKFIQEYEKRFMAYEFMIACIISAIINVFAGEYAYFGAPAYAVISLFSVCIIGFLVLVRAVSFLLCELPEFKLLRQSNHDITLAQLYESGARWFTILAFCSLILVFRKHGVEYLVVFLLIICSFRLVRSIWAFNKLCAVVENSRYNRNLRKN